MKGKIQIFEGKKSNFWVEKIKFLRGKNQIFERKKSNFWGEKIKFLRGKNQIFEGKKSNFWGEKIQNGGKKSKMRRKNPKKADRIQNKVRESKIN